MRSSNIAVLKVHNAQRVIAWHRWVADREFVVVASLNNSGFGEYTISHRNLKGKVWVEVLNSDAQIYGGSGMHTEGDRDSSDGTLHMCLPANGLVVLARKN